MTENLRRCSKCQEHKPVSQFGVKKQRKDGINLWCKPCVKVSIDAYRGTPEGRKSHNEREKERSRANPEANRQRVKDWISGNQERHNENNKDNWRIRYASPEYRLLETIRQREWAGRNPAKAAHKASRRRTAKLGATPAWLTAIQKAQIRQFYEIAAALKAQTGICYTVDHIHPLRGENFSGLHVPWNLQILSHSRNSSKANRVEPEHAEAFFTAA